jgi:signal transduction histidine kinase
VAYDFVDKMSGSIWVESEEGKGSTFFVKLPNCISKD